MTCGKQPLDPSSTMSDSGIRQRSTSPEARVATREKNDTRQKRRGEERRISKWRHHNIFALQIIVLQERGFGLWASSFGGGRVESDTFLSICFTAFVHKAVKTARITANSRCTRARSSGKTVGTYARSIEVQRTSHVAARYYTRPYSLMICESFLANVWLQTHRRLR